MALVRVPSRTRSPLRQQVVDDLEDDKNLQGRQQHPKATTPVEQGFDNAPSATMATILQAGWTCRRHPLTTASLVGSGVPGPVQSHVGRAKALPVRLLACRMHGARKLEGRRALPVGSRSPRHENAQYTNGSGGSTRRVAQKTAWKSHQTTALDESVPIRALPWICWRREVTRSTLGITRSNEAGMGGTATAPPDPLRRDPPANRRRPTWRFHHIRQPVLGWRWGNAPRE